ncbi:MAG: DUF4411 family protein [Eubacteriaceae bacterium]
MNQLSFINPPYKYIFDASSFLSQKENDRHPKSVYKQLWDNISNLIYEQKIVTCTEIRDEIKNDETHDWFRKCGCICLDITNEIQNNVILILEKKPKLIEFLKVKSSADAFLIATAMVYNLTVVTEESKEKYNKIPDVCREFNINCINILDLCKVENWVF